MRHFLWAVLPVICLLAPAAQAQSLDKDVALAIREFADSICGVYELEGSEDSIKLEGEARASVEGLLSKLTDLGIDGSTSFSQEKYTNVFREDIADELKDIRTCRIEIWKDLKDTLILVEKKETKFVQPEFHDDFAAGNNQNTRSTPRRFVPTAFPSFDCGKARTTDEKILCVVPAAANQDQQLSAVYGQLRRSLSSADKGRLTDTQKRWLAYRGQTCLIGVEFEWLSDAQLSRIGNCIATITRDRVSQLRSSF